MSKQYGLIIPGKEKKPAPAANFSRPSVFGSDSDSGEEQKPSKVGLSGPGEAQKRQARLAQEKAVEEDPTVFQYDELYEDMDNRRKEETAAKKKVQHQGPKYIKKLLETAEKRKKEYERRVERLVQKERDAEGEQFKDKESFVTSSYKKKLEEMAAAEEEEKRAEYLESIGDVQKQCNLDGFYRHLYAQKTSTANISVPEPATTSKKERRYRKRENQEDEKEEEEEMKPTAAVHIASNIDADSDFSIDSSDSEEEKDEVKENENPDQPIKEVDQEPAAGLGDQEAEKSEDVTAKSPEKENDEEVIEEPAPKKVKIDIWAKRTVGDAFDDAVKRYFERKAARSGG